MNVFNLNSGVVRIWQYSVSFRGAAKGFNNSRGAWVAQSVGRPTLAQVTISRSVSSSPASGSVLTARGLEPAWDSVSPSLSAPPPPTLCLSFSLSKINKHLKKCFFKWSLL